MDQDNTPRMHEILTNSEDGTEAEQAERLEYTANMTLKEFFADAKSMSENLVKELTGYRDPYWPTMYIKGRDAKDKAMIHVLVMPDAGLILGSENADKVVSDMFSELKATSYAFVIMGTGYKMGNIDATDEELDEAAQRIRARDTKGIERQDFLLMILGDREAVEVWLLPLKMSDMGYSFDEWIRSENIRSLDVSIIDLLQTGLINS